MLALPLLALSSPSSLLPSKSQQALLYTNERTGIAMPSSGAAADPIQVTTEYEQNVEPCPGLACSLGLWPLPKSLLPMEGEGADPDGKEGALTRHDAKKKSERCKGLAWTLARNTARSSIFSRRSADNNSDGVPMSFNSSDCRGSAEPDGRGDPPLGAGPCSRTPPIVLHHFLPG